jgi:hypothetical protein
MAPPTGIRRRHPKEHEAMTRITNMLRRRRDLGRWAIVIASLAAAFLVALTAPIPTLPDAGRAEVRAEVADRLPGWSVQRIDPTWENAYAVVTSCAGRKIDFQFVPGHGLPRDDAWIQPHNSYARARLGATSDHHRYLLWRGNDVHPARMECSENLARDGSSGAADPGRD